MTATTESPHLAPEVQRTLAENNVRIVSMGRPWVGQGDTLAAAVKRANFNIKRTPNLHLQRATLGPASEKRRVTFTEAWNRLQKKDRAA